MTDTIDQRPPLERAAEAVSDALEGAAQMRGEMIAMLARGELQKDQHARLGELLSVVDGGLLVAAAAIGEVPQ
jgi:hypothetical protein